MAIDERDYLRERIIAFERQAAQSLTLLGGRRGPGFWARLLGHGST